MIKMAKFLVIQEFDLAQKQGANISQIWFLQSFPHQCKAHWLKSRMHAAYILLS